MHSRVRWWTEQSIDWFIRASSYTDYHEVLAKHIIDNLNQDVVTKEKVVCKSVLELGCGLGYQAEALYRYGFDVQAYDINLLVIQKAKERTKLNIFHQADASEVDGLYDAVLCINYGHILEPSGLSALMAHAKKRLIYVISRHNAHGTDTREDKTESIKNLLRSAGYQFSVREICLNFDQPLKSMEEALEFINFTYLGRNTESYLRFVEKSGYEDYPYIFRNKKSIVLFSINRILF